VSPTVHRNGASGTGFCPPRAPAPGTSRCPGSEVGARSSRSGRRLSASTVLCTTMSDVLRLQEPDDVERRPARRQRRDDSREAHARDGGIGGGPLQREWADQSAALPGTTTWSVSISRRQHERNGLLDRDVARLYDHRRRGRETARARDLHGSLTGSERDDHPVLVHARDVGAQRFPGHGEGRSGGPVVFECTRSHTRILGRQEVHGRRLHPEYRGRSGPNDLTGERPPRRRSGRLGLPSRLCGSSGR